MFPPGCYCEYYGVRALKYHEYTISIQCALYHITITNSEIWIINHYLGLFHENSVCSLSYTIFGRLSSFSYSLVFVYKHYILPSTIITTSGCWAYVYFCQTPNISLKFHFLSGSCDKTVWYVSILCSLTRMYWYVYYIYYLHRYWVYRSTTLM